LVRNCEAWVQPGALVKVVEYYGDGIARIEWGGGEQTGYIAKDDLRLPVEIR
jgi:hypothetical protein